MAVIVSLCETCASMKEVISGKGSRFLLCRLAQQDRRFPKYPPQPTVRCGGYSFGHKMTKPLSEQS